YSNTEGPKAASYHPIHGRIFVVTKAANQHAAEEAALKNCNEDTASKGGSGSCFLYAVGNRVVLPLRLKEPLTAPIAAAATPPAPASLQELLAARLASAEPGQPLKVHEDDTRNYEAALSHKALAAAPQNAGSWRAAERPTTDNAEASVRESCQIFYGQTYALL